MADINPYDFQSQPQTPVILPPLIIEKPTSVTVFGVLNCVFGGLFFVCIPAAVFFVLMAGKTGGPPEAHEPMLYISLAVVFVLSAWEILTGIGLLKFASWARRSTIIYASCEIIWILVNIVMSIMALSARHMNVPEGSQAFQSGYQIGYYVGRSCGWILVLIYPVLLLIFMNTRKVKEAFAAKERLNQTSM